MQLAPSILDLASEQTTHVPNVLGRWRAAEFDERLIGQIAKLQNARIHLAHPLIRILIVYSNMIMSLRRRTLGFTRSVGQ
jgi:hypothetical protein